MALSSDQRKNFRFLLLMIILLTIPCYCLGFVVLRLADQVEEIEQYPQDTPPPLNQSTFTPAADLPTSTLSANLTPTEAETATLTVTTIFTKTPFFPPTRTATLTPTHTLTPTFTLTPIPTNTATVTPSPTLIPTITETPVPTQTETTVLEENAPPLLPDAKV